MKNYLLKGLFYIFITSVIFSDCSSGSVKRKEEIQQKKRTIREIKYGRLLANKIIQKFPLLKNESINRYINKVGKSVAIFAGRSDIEFYFAVLDTESINAYATPGGYVFISMGALLKIENEAELAGVLAHEIGHINRMHIMKDLPPPRETGGFVNLLASLLVSQGGAVSSAFSEAVNKASDLLFTKGYKIEDEYEADSSAILYVNETGYYPLGLIDFLNRIWQHKRTNAAVVVYNTHPPFEERINRLNTLIEDGSFNKNRPKVKERFLSEIKNLKKK